MDKLKVGVIYRLKFEEFNLLFSIENEPTQKTISAKLVKNLNDSYVSPIFSFDSNLLKYNVLVFKNLNGD